MPTNKATLNIYKRYKDSAFSDELLWNRAQSKTNDWTKAYVVLVSDKPFQVSIFVVVADELWLNVPITIVQFCDALPLNS